MSYSLPEEHSSRLTADCAIYHITVAKRSQISEVIMEIISPLKWIRSCPYICLIKHQNVYMPVVETPTRETL